MKATTKLAAAFIIIVGFFSANAWSFDRSGYVDQGFFYSGLQIVRGDPVPFNTGGVSGRVRHIYPWLLRGIIENPENRDRFGVQMRFTATACDESKVLWSVVVNVGPMSAFEQTPFLKKIADYEPARPCYLRARAYSRD